MNEIIIATASSLTKEKKYLNIPAGNILSKINPSEAIDNGKLNGVDIQIANVMSNEINNIKHNIIPAIKEYGKFVQEAIAKKVNTNPMDSVNIFYASIPDAIDELIGRDVIKTNGVLRTLDNKNLIIPRPEVAQIREYLVYGSGQMESMIKSFTSSVSDAELIRIWDTYLTRITSDNTNYISLGYKVNAGVYGLDLWILSIIVKNLINTVPNGIRAAAGSYNDTILTLDAVLDAKIARVDNLIKSNEKIGKVIYKAETISEVIVIKSVYDKFLNEDGSPEAIYGAVLSGAKTAGMDTLKKNTITYVQKWNDHAKNVSIKQQLGNLEHNRMAYRLGISEVINKFLSEEVKATIPELLLKDVGSIVVSYMNKTPNEDLFNIPKTVNEIITGIFFEHTNAKEFIGYMKHYSQLNPGITPQEAATYASMDLVTDYLLSQLEIN